MRRREYLLSAALLVACAPWLVGFVRNERAGQRWEYMVVAAEAYQGVHRLNIAGDERWELVAVTAGPAPSDPRIFYFKRAK